MAKQDSQNTNVHFILLALFSLLILFVDLHRGDLSGYDDAIYAYEGREMVLSGDWWNVRFNGYLHFEFPPMFIWLEAVSMALLGFHDFAAKFPSALLGFGTILLVYYIARELTDDPWLPLMAMLVLISTQYFIKYAKHAMTDAPFTFFFTLGIFFYVKGLQNPRYLALSGLPVSFAMLTRSILGIIPLGIFAMHLLATKKYELVRSRYSVGSVLIAFSLPIIWLGVQYSLHRSQFLTLHFSFILSKMSSAGTLDIWQAFLGITQYPKLLLAGC